MTIRSLAGEPLPLELSEGVTVGVAKSTIERDVGVQASSLGIFDSGRECSDWEQLQGTQPLTLVIKLEPALHDLQLTDEEDPLHRRRSSALLFLYAHVPREDARTMSRIAAAFGRASSWIRPTTVGADAARYATGDGRAILGVVALLDHPEASVRQAAVEAIPTVCEKGDELALRAVAWRLVSDRSLAKTEALMALGTLAPGADDRALQLVVSRMESDAQTDEASKRAALLCCCVGRDCRVDCVNAVVALLREKAIAATTTPPPARVVEGGGEVVSKLSAGVEHWLTYSADRLRLHADDRTHGDESQRPAILPSPGQAEPPNQEHPVRLQTLDAVATRLGKADSKAWKCLREQAVTFPDEVRAYILDVIQPARVTDPDRAMDLVVAKLEDPSSDARLAALLLVWFLVKPGDRRGLELASSRLMDELRDVRITAVQVVVQLAEKGDFYAFRSLAGNLCDPDAFVRAEAVRGMGELGVKNDSRAVDLLSEVLHQADATPTTQAAALQALAASSDPSDQRARGLMEEFLLHEHSAVSSASMQVMSKVGQNQGVTSAWETRNCRFKDFDIDRDKAQEVYANHSKLIPALAAPSGRQRRQSAPTKHVVEDVDPGGNNEGWAEHVLMSGESITRTMTKVWSMFSSDAEKQPGEPAVSRVSHAV